LHGLVGFERLLKIACNIMSSTYKGVGGWVNDALRHRQPSCVHRQMATAALTIPRAVQKYNGTEFDPKLSY